MPDPRFPFSNFEAVPGGLAFEGIVYPTAEHAYQAAKTTDMTERRRIASLPTPGQAKRAGRLIPLDWDDRKAGVMAQILAIKFSREPFRSRLMAHTGDIVEWNTWHDGYWGVCTCGRASCRRSGANVLGLLLMAIRRTLLVGSR